MHRVVHLVESKDLPGRFVLPRNRSIRLLHPWYVSSLFPMSTIANPPSPAFFWDDQTGAAAPSTPVLNVSGSPDAVRMYQELWVKHGKLQESHDVDAQTIRAMESELQKLRAERQLDIVRMEQQERSLDNLNRRLSNANKVVSSQGKSIELQEAQLLQQEQELTELRSARHTAVQQHPQLQAFLAHFPEQVSLIVLRRTVSDFFFIVGRNPRV